MQVEPDAHVVDPVQPVYKNHESASCLRREAESEVKWARRSPIPPHWPYLGTAVGLAGAVVVVVVPEPLLLTTSHTKVKGEGEGVKGERGGTERNGNGKRKGTGGCHPRQRASTHIARTAAGRRGPLTRS